jgi:soluble lytic murein transglycosylase-like protein
MNKHCKFIILRTLTLLWVITPYMARADVYVDLSQTDGINIGNAEPDKYYSIRIEEPQELTIVNPNHPKNENTNQLPYHNEVLLAAKETALDPALIHAIMTVESQHNAKAKSKKGAYGLMQLMPETARRFNVKDKNDPKQNILAGSKYLRELLDLFNGNLKLSLAAYNAGPAVVQNYRNTIPPYRETIQYVPKVLKYYRQYS